MADDGGGEGEGRGGVGRHNQGVGCTPIASTAGPRFIHTFVRFSLAWWSEFSVQLFQPEIFLHPSIHCQFAELPDFVPMIIRL